MKKQFLFITLLLSTMLLVTVTSLVAAMENSFLSVEVVTEETLGQYDSYHEFIEFDEKDYQKIIFQAAVPLKEFKFIEVSHDDNAMPAKGRVLYSLDELNPDKPFVVTWMEWGLLPHRGITFIDENKEPKCYSIGLHGDDGSIVLNECQ